MSVDQDRGTTGGLALPGHKLEQSRTPHIITDEVSRLDHYLMCMSQGS